MERTESPAPGLSLCSPSDETACFACCPPIRPHGYDHLDFRGSLRREFSDNRTRFLKDGPRFKPIVGYHCWALGFLDPRGRRVGCLLHPAGNNGEDLRDLIDYGNKCARENCTPARMFNLLKLEGQRFWLTLAEGLDSFQFSSLRTNPLFRLSLWGPHVLESMQAIAAETGLTAKELLERHPFLVDEKWNPLAHRCLFRIAMEAIGAEKAALAQIEEGGSVVLERLLAVVGSGLSTDHQDEAPFTHTLPMEADFLDLIRLGLGRRRVLFTEAEELRAELLRLAEKIFLMGRS